MASFSISLGGGSRTRKPSPPPPQNGIKRTFAALDDAESDEEDLNIGKRQNVTHFDVAAGGAVDVSKPKVVKEALVIKPQANRDWKQASLRNKRQKYGLPSEEQEKAKQNFVAPVPTTSFGLNVHSRETASGNAQDETSQQDHERDVEHTQTNAVSTKPKTDDERAIAALMGVKEESTLTIPAVTEDEALERDVQEAPDAPTLAEYAAVPVEDFGAAMLRGMGWKEGQGIGNQRGQKTVKSKVPERRPALLGIGAKPDAAVAAELGAWGAGAKGRKRVDIVYNPLVLKNSKTGEQVTEEELKVKLQEQKEREANEKYVAQASRERQRDDNSSRRHHRDVYDSEDRAERHRKDRRRDREYDDDRRSSRRDRSTSVDKHRSRRERSASYDKYREKRRDKDYSRNYDDDRKDKDRRRDRRERDHREKTRDHGRYDDDRERRHRR